MATDRRRDWYRIEAKADAKTVEVWIYDAIGADLFGDGVTAKNFATELQGIDAEKMTVHLNTPGGDAFQGLAIYNAIKDHPAKVTVSVDGLAASAGSFIAQAGDRVRMNRGAQMMIHDAAGFAVGNSSDMLKLAEVLDKTSDSLAGIYASRAGGTVADWREAMRVESWYTAAEAVEAGLADEMVDEDPPEPPVRNAWDLSVFAYAGRDRAPAPPILNRRTRREPPEAPVTAGASSYPTKGAKVSLAKYREALAGLPDDASEDEVRAALASAGLDPQPDKPTTPAPDPAPQPNPDPQPAPTEPAPKLVHASGTRVVAESVWTEMQNTIKGLQSFVDKTQRDERDQVIAKAVENGKFTPAQKPHFAKLWDTDPKGTRELIDSLTPNTALAVAAMGYAGDGSDDEFDREFGGLFGPAGVRKGASRG